MEEGEKFREIIKIGKEIRALIDVGKMTIKEGEDWVRLQGVIERCEKCDLGQSCTKKVFGVGNPKAPFFIVGEAPGVEEDLLGEPFVDQSGELFREKMQEAGFQKGDVYMTNVLCCRPPDSRLPTREEIGACFMRLWQQLEITTPEVIIVVGSVALKTLAPKNKRAIGACRGDAISAYGYKIIPVWHPNYVLRMHSALRERELYKDLRKAYGHVFPV